MLAAVEKVAAATVAAEPEVDSVVAAKEAVMAEAVLAET